MSCSVYYIYGLADDHSHTHKANLIGNTHLAGQQTQSRPRVSTNLAETVSQFKSTKPVNLSEPVSSSGMSSKSSPFVPKHLPRQYNLPQCGYCEREGHVISDCFKLQRKELKVNTVGLGLVTSAELSSELVKSHVVVVG